MKAYLLIVLLTVSIAVFTTARDTSLKLQVLPGSSRQYISITILNEVVDTDAVELKEYDNQWTHMEKKDGGVWMYSAADQAKGLNFPLSFRLSANDHLAVTLEDAIAITSAGMMIFDTKAHYLRDESPAPKKGKPIVTSSYSNVPTSTATVAPVVEDEDSESPTANPTDPPTEAPTDATQEPSSAPTQPPSTKATQAPPPTAATNAPIRVATQPPSNAPTQSPTNAPSQVPTASPTKTPTQAPTQAPSMPPTQAPTKAATQAPTSSPTNSPTAPPTAPASSGACGAKPKIMVPLYVYPGAAWDAVIAGNQYAETLAIINPRSGPASPPNSAYVTYMQKMKNANVDMIGYVYTGWGNRDINVVKADIDIYANQYPHLKGVFLDEAATEANKLPYYRALYDHIMSKPNWKYDVVNPGTVPDSGYLSASTQIVSLENYGSEVSRTSAPGWGSCNNKEHFAAIVHTVSQGNMQSTIRAINNLKYFGYIYVTDGPGGCCTYNNLAAYHVAAAQFTGTLTV